MQESAHVQVSYSERTVPPAIRTALAQAAADVAARFPISREQLLIQVGRVCGGGPDWLPPRGAALLTEQQQPPWTESQRCSAAGAPPGRAGEACSHRGLQGRQWAHACALHLLPWLFHLGLSAQVSA